MAEVVVLGSAQDGGLPHAGCRCPQCERARADPAFARYPASVGVVDDDELVLVDATMAFAEQVHRLWLRSPAASDTDTTRYRAPRTILLTHAHTGHYVGLWQLDRSVMAADSVSVLAPPRMAMMLAENEPWTAMQHEGFIRIDPLTIDITNDVTSRVRITPIEVPHRAEWGTETVALRIAGPERSLLYLPDIDAWDDWAHDISDVIAAVDVALIDGCFWEPFPIPGVPHPPVRASLDRLQPLADAGRQIVFTHLNHSNPLVDPESPEHREVLGRGFHVAREGDTFTL
jgi:pyrroloquinoline quinone biosynthesis protein B